MAENKIIYADQSGNTLKLSSVFQAHQSVDFSHFSAKYVVSGQERYQINNKNFLIKQGEYVIGNQCTEAKVLIDNQTLVRGICIDISKDLIEEIIRYSYKNTETFSEFLFTQDWMVQKYNYQNTKLGYSISQIALEFEQLKTDQSTVSKELFLSIAECIVRDQSAIFESFNKLTSKKQETNARLFDFVNDARNYIESNFLEPICLEDISRQAKISEYHFIRVFKSVFKTTPYKYLTKKRLQYGHDLLNSNYSISDVSAILGYTDNSAFSNAFKNCFGYTPGQINRN